MFVVHDGEQPTTTAFVDAIFDGQTTLDGVEAICVDELDTVSAIVARIVQTGPGRGDHTPLIASSG